MSRAYKYTIGTTQVDTDLNQATTDQAGNVTSYVYTPENQIQSATTGSATQSWTYDADGNRLTSTNPTPGASPINATYNADNELCNTTIEHGSTCSGGAPGETTYTYDGAGNLTAASAGSFTAATYNTFSQTASTTSAGTVTDDTYSDIYSDQRTASGSTNFINGILGVTRQTTGSAVTSFIRDPYGNLIAMETGGTSYYYTTDNIGSVLLLTDSSGNTAAAYTYDTWGNTLTATGAEAAANPWRYTSGYADPNGLIKDGTRYYNPTTGTFTQPDPTGLNPDYTYAGDNPINASDPTGMFSLDDALGDISTAASVAGDALDATGIGGPAGAILDGVSVAASAGKAAYDCTEESSGDCEKSAAGAAVDAASFGTARGLAKIGADTASTAASSVGAGYDINDTLGG